MPAVSVIVPVYNGKKYLARCVKSVLAQSFSDFELLLVDDGSSDGSQEEEEAYRSDPRVRVLKKPHGGLGDTRNYGAEHASGKYLTFVDSDDWIGAAALHDLFTAAEAARADLIVFNFVRETEAGSRVCRLPLRGRESGAAVNEKLLAELIGPDPDDSPWHGAEMLGSACRRFCLRSWFSENRIRFGDERTVMLEDLPVAIEEHCACRHLLVLGGAYYHYFCNRDSLSTRYRPHKMEMLTACFRGVEETLGKYGLTAKYGERHLAWFLRSATHSSLVNCFSPGSPAGFSARWREVRGILANPVLRSAARSDYLRHAARSDRIVLRLLRTHCTPLVYLFYRVYSRVLRSSTKKQ